MKRLLVVSILFLVIVFSGCTSENNSGLVELQSKGHLIVQDTAGKLIIRDAADPLLIAANLLYGIKGKGIIVSDASRTVETQARLFYKNCLSTKDGFCTKATCNPTTNKNLVVGDSNVGYLLVGSLIYEEESKVISTIAANSKPENCPHTSNVAVDVWCEGVSGMTVDPQCQKALTEVMINSGFCRIPNEAWHFEWNAKMVSKKSCSQNVNATYTIKGVPYDPTTDGKGNECILWDYRENKCVKTKSSGLESIYDGTYKGTFSYEYRDAYFVAGSNEEQFTPWKQDSFDVTLTMKTIRMPYSTDKEGLVQLDATNVIVSDPNFGASSGTDPKGYFDSQENVSLPLNPAILDTGSNIQSINIVLYFPNGSQIEVRGGKDSAGKYAIKISPDGKTLSLNPEWVNPIKNPGNPGYAWEAKTPKGSLWTGTPTAETGVWMSRNYNFKNWGLTKESS